MRQILFVLMLGVAVSVGTSAEQTASSPATPEKLGTVHFETSCSPAVRGDFDRGVSLLHSFEFRPAMRLSTSCLRSYRPADAGAATSRTRARKQTIRRAIRAKFVSRRDLPRGLAAEC